MTIDDEPRELRIRLARVGEIPLVHGLTREGFEDYRRFSNPSSALSETVDDVGRAVAAGGAVLAFSNDEPVATARFAVRWAEPPAFDVQTAIERAAEGTRLLDSPGGSLAFSRMAVLPRERGRGIGRRLVAWLEHLGDNLGLSAIEISVRSQQPDNRPYYVRLGYRITGYSERYGIADMVTYMRKDLT